MVRAVRFVCSGTLAALHLDGVDWELHAVDDAAPTGRKDWRQTRNMVTMSDNVNRRWNKMLEVVQSSHDTLEIMQSALILHVPIFCNLLK